MVAESSTNRSESTSCVILKTNFIEQTSSGKCSIRNQPRVGTTSRKITLGISVALS